MADKRSSTKQKSHRGAAKRFRYTASGRLKHRHAFRSHNLEHKSAKRKRGLRREGFVGEEDASRIQTLLPYPQETR